MFHTAICGLGLGLGLEHFGLGLDTDGLGLGLGTAGLDYKSGEMYITAQGPRLRNDLYCVEWDVKLYYTIPYLYEADVLKKFKFECYMASIL